MTEIEPVADCECERGYGPLWHPLVGLLYWLDIPNGQVFAHDPIAGTHDIVYARDGPIGGFTTERDASLLLFEEDGRIEAWDGEDARQIRGRLLHESGSRFNAVLAGPDGGVFAATLARGESPGRMYYFGPGGIKRVIEEGVECVSGMGFSPDLEHLYVVEASSGTVSRYAFTPTTGAVKERELFLDCNDRPGGMCVDSMGHLWIAFEDAGRIERRNQRGELVETIETPVSTVTSVTLGGFDYRSGFVTTAAGSDAESAGSLFRFDADVRGLPEFRSELTF